MARPTVRMQDAALAMSLAVVRPSKPPPPLPPPARQAHGVIRASIHPRPTAHHPPPITTAASLPSIRATVCTCTPPSRAWARGARLSTRHGKYKTKKNKSRKEKEARALDAHDKSLATRPTPTPTPTVLADPASLCSGCTDAQPTRSSRSDRPESTPHEHRPRFHVIVSLVYSVSRPQQKSVCPLSHRQLQQTPRTCRQTSEPVSRTPAMAGRGTHDPLSSPTHKTPSPNSLALRRARHAYAGYPSWYGFSW